ncbi:MAG: ATP-binding protein [Nitrosospira sp.]
MKSLEDWQAANDKYLSAAVAWVRLLVEQRASPPPILAIPSAVSPGAPGAPYDVPDVPPAPTGAPEAEVAPPAGNRTRRKFKKTENPAPAGSDSETAIPSVALSSESSAGSAKDDPVSQAAAEMAAAEKQMTPPPALVLLSQRLGLSRFERDILLLCTALELDTRIAGLCAQVQDNPARPYPTFALALTLFSEPAWEALSPERPLRYWRLIEINQPGSQPLTTSALRADERIVSYIKGLNYLDDRLTPLLAPVAPATGDPLPPSQQHVVDNVLQRWHSGDARNMAAPGTLPVVQLLGPDEPSKRLIAAHTAASLGLHLYRLPAAFLPPQNADQETLARLWQRETALLPLALYLDAQESANAQEGSQSAVSRFLSRCDGAIFLATREPWPHLDRANVALDVAKPTPDEQRCAWIAALGDTAKNVPALPDQLSAQFNLDLAAVRQIAHEEFLAKTSDQALPNRLWDACRASVRPRLEALAQRLEVKASWEDIVLPDEEMQALRQIAGQVSQRTKVYQTWGFANKMNRGFGISALFAGESGTGKTMAAEVIANELRLDLYRIDLSAVVNKYIGETEKNLRRLFDAAEDGGAILLFDEADALFGKRSEVKDSHDRYANIEINYLLQRVESYRGLAILATNMKGALDTAFMRRLRFIVNFSVPAAPQRKAIWQKVFPPEARTEGLDYDRLARLNLTGGLIHNVALNAAFLAAQNGTAVTLPLVLIAARAEFRKLDRPINEGDFRWLEQAASTGVQA